MFDLINGLPVHPLVVHAVVVLLPLASIGAIAIALRPSWRRQYGVLVVACAAFATVLIPVATSSGEALERRVGDPGAHASMGDQLIWFAIPLLVLVSALVWFDRRANSSLGTDPVQTQSAGGKVGLVHVIAALTVIAALATTVQVYRVGDSGARAAWGDQVSSTN